MQRELQNLEDAETDIMMLIDEDERIPYRIGEVFVHLTQDEVQERLESDKQKVSHNVRNVCAFGRLRALLCGVMCIQHKLVYVVEKVIIAR